MGDIFLLLQVGRRALGVDDAAPGRHPVDGAWLDALDGAQAVAMHHRAFEQVSDGRQPDMRMRPHVVVVARAGGDRAEVIEEHKRPYALPWRDGWKQPPHHESAAQVPAAWWYEFFDGHRRSLSSGRVIGPDLGGDLRHQLVHRALRGDVEQFLPLLRG